MHQTNQTAFCTDLTRPGFDLSPGAEPGEVELIPAGPTVAGRDGRTWTFDGPAASAVVAAFIDRAAALPIDWEHASQHRAPNGEEAPAAGWIESLEVRDGALWGRVEWTERGRTQVAAREYRYLSPVFDYEPDTGRIVRLVCAGLTNLPNLHLQALNREELPMKRSAQLTAAIVSALGLPEGADDDAIVSALNQLHADHAAARALNTDATPSLDRYVPRADYDAQVQRTTNAEQALSQRISQEHDAAVDAVIADALKDGKISPATADYHRAACADSEGLARFREFVAAAPVIAADSQALNGTPPATGTALNAEQREAARLLGMTEPEYRAALAQKE